MLSTTDGSEFDRDVEADRRYRVAYQHPLLFLAIAAVAGVLIDSALADSVLQYDELVDRGATDRAVADGPLAAIRGAVRWWGWIAVAAIALVGIAWPRQLPGWLASSLAVVLVMATAALNHAAQDRRYESVGLPKFLGRDGQPAIIEGTLQRTPLLQRHPLADLPDRRDLPSWQTQFELAVQKMRVGLQDAPMEGRVSVVVSGRCDHLQPGDRLRVYGQLERFAAPTNPGQRDLRLHSRRRGLHARLMVADVDQVVRLDRSPPRAWLARAVARAARTGREVLLQQLDHQCGPLAVALVIGQRDFVDPATRDLLLVTGTAHLLSVSGMHLAIVMVMATWLSTALRMPIRGKVIFILTLCVIYAAITGARPPVMRAAVLVITFLFALWMKRTSQPLNTLSLAALLLVFWNPENVFSVGVHLSFLAVGTLLMCARRPNAHSQSVDAVVQHEQQLQKLVDQSQSRWRAYLRWAMGAIGHGLWISGCVSVITAPLVWHHFHVVSPISVVANVLLGPLLCVSLGSGIATVLVGSISTTAAAAPALVCQWSLGLMRRVIEMCAECPGGHFWLPSPPQWWVWMFYAVLALSLMMPPGRTVRGVRWIWIAGWMLVALALATRPAPLDSDSVEATFVDVGHGTSVVLRFPDGQVWLYDCGRLGNAAGSSRFIDTTLWSLGVCKLDGVWLSHADADHFNALPGLLRRFDVDRIVTPPGMLQEPEPALDPIRAAIAGAAVDIQQVHWDPVDWGQADWRAGRLGDRTPPVAETSVRVLHPPRDRLVASDNANSLVLQIRWGGKTILLPGDLEPPGTEQLIRHRRPPPGGILMAPHHGSLAMDAATVLQWARPRETIVSGGPQARRPQVREMLQRTGSGVHVTADVGAIRVRIDRHGGVEIRSWRDQPW